MDVRAALIYVVFFNKSSAGRVTAGMLVISDPLHVKLTLHMNNNALKLVGSELESRSKKDKHNSQLKDLTWTLLVQINCPGSGSVFYVEGGNDSSADCVRKHRANASHSSICY